MLRQLDRGAWTNIQNMILRHSTKDTSQLFRLSKHFRYLGKGCFERFIFPVRADKVPLINFMIFNIAVSGYDREQL